MQNTSKDRRWDISPVGFMLPRLSLLWMLVGGGHAGINLATVLYGTEGARVRVPSIELAPDSDSCQEVLAVSVRVQSDTLALI